MEPQLFKLGFFFYRYDVFGLWPRFVAFLLKTRCENNGFFVFNGTMCSASGLGAAFASPIRQDSGLFKNPFLTNGFFVLYQLNPHNDNELFKFLPVYQKFFNRIIRHGFCAAKKAASK
jgi:hypothetical protein